MHIKQGVTFSHQNTGAFLRVHPSNYRVVGFSGQPGLEELVGLAGENDIPLIDDLGAGYASLNSVALVGPEFIKIDMSLIRDIDESPRKRSLVASLVQFALDAEISVIAEGIETEGEAAACRQLGCELLQGYLFGKPAPLPDL